MFNFEFILSLKSECLSVNFNVQTAMVNFNHVHIEITKQNND